MADEPTTKRVRIRVVIDELGNWTSMGYGTASKPISDDELTRMVCDCDDFPDGDRNWLWIEVDLPLPRKNDRTIHAKAISA